MRVERLISMILRRFMGPAINAGIDRTMGKGKAPEDMTPEERQQAKQAKQTAKQARQMARMGRRIGKF